MAESLSPWNAVLGGDPWERSSVSCKLAFSPAGRKRIAQRFNAGLGVAQVEQVPSGTAERRAAETTLLPSLGLEDIGGTIAPALKCLPAPRRQAGRAIRFRPDGLETAVQESKMHPRCGSRENCFWLILLAA